MATIAETPVQSSERPTQNWVVNPVSDLLFVIGAPLVALALFAPIFWLAPGFDVDGTSLIFLIFVGFNLGHHVPMFVRIWGDKALVERFRWNLFLAPIVPFVGVMLVAAYLISHGLPIRDLLFLYIILNIWDPWHFTMQNHGFMRIYDRHNKAPRKLAGRMDFALGWTWFIAIMLGAVNWAPGLLYKLQFDSGIPMLWLFTSGTYRVLEIVAFSAAVIMSCIYAGYLWWCYNRGYYISPAKMLFFGITYGIMYLTYVPNPLMQSALPGWGFMAGFATLGMVHVSQNVAIVWKYSRSLALRGTHARPGLFTRMFARGGPWILLGYVALCLAYGFGLLQLTRLEGWFVWFHDKWPTLMSADAKIFLANAAIWLTAIALAVNFTSTITHYYWEGFVWKMRHKENRDNLSLEEGNDRDSENVSLDTSSWWDRRRASPAMRMLARHCLYFGLPIAIIAGGAWWVHADPARDPRATQTLGNQAESLYKQGLVLQSLETFQDAVAAADRRILLEEQMIDIRPQPVNYIGFATANYLRSRYATLRIAPLEQGQPDISRLDQQTQLSLLTSHLQEVEKSISASENALAMPAGLTQVGLAANELMTQQEAEEFLSKLKSEATELRQNIAKLGDSSSDPHAAATSRQSQQPSN